MKKNLLLCSLIFVILSSCKAQQQMQPPIPCGGFTDSLPLLLGMRTAKDTAPCIPDMERVKAYLTSMPYVRNCGSLKEDALIRDYGFRKLMQQNFGTLILGSENISKIGRYGTLDLSEKPAFDFSPYTFESDRRYKPYQNIWAVNFSGKLNSESIFKLKDFRELSLGVSFVHILNWSNFKAIDRSDSIRCVMKAKTRESIEELCDEYKKKFKEACDSSCYKKLTGKTKKEKVEHSFYEDFSDLEIKAAEELWATKNFFWVNVSAKATRDKVKYIQSAKLASDDPFKPTEEAIFTPSLTIALNYLTKKNNSTGSFLVSVWAAVQNKHSFSDVFEPEDFQPVHEVNDSTFRNKELESVFVTNLAELSEQVAFDFGIRAVRMIDISSLSRKKSFGLSFSFSRSGLVSDGKFPSLFRTEAGVVIPFLKADGTSTFNLELFYRSDVYSGFTAANDDFLGVRFNVPISSR